MNIHYWILIFADVYLIVLPAFVAGNGKQAN